MIERVNGHRQETTASTVAPTIPKMLPNTVTTTADVHHQPQHYEAHQIPINYSASRQDAEGYHQAHQAAANNIVPMEVQSQWPQQPAQGASIHGQQMRHQFMPIAPALPTQQYGAPMFNQTQRQPLLPVQSQQEGSAPQPPPPGTEDGVITLHSIDDVPPPPFPQQQSAPQPMHHVSMAPLPFTGEPQRQVRASAHQPLPPGVGGSAPAKLCKVADHVGLHINPMCLPAVIEHEKKMAEVALTTKRLPFQDLCLSNDYEMTQPEVDKPYALTVTYKTDLPVPACPVIGYEKFAPLT